MMQTNRQSNRQTDKQTDGLENPTHADRQSQRGFTYSIDRPGDLDL